MLRLSCQVLIERDFFLLWGSSWKIVKTLRVLKTSWRIRQIIEKVYIFSWKSFFFFFTQVILNIKKQPPEVFCKIGFFVHLCRFKCMSRSLRGFFSKSMFFAKFVEKQLCHSLFFYKVAGLRKWNFIKKAIRHKRFPVNFDFNLDIEKWSFSGKKDYSTVDSL